MFGQFIKSRYKEKDGITRRKALYLFIISLVLLAILPVVNITSYILNPDTILNSIIGTVPMGIAAVLSIILISRGKNDIAGYIMITVVSLALVFVIIVAKPGRGVSISGMYVYALLVMAILFGNRIIASIVTALMFATVLFSYYLSWKTGMDMEVLNLSLNSFIISILLSYILLMLLVGALKNAIDKARNETENSLKLLNSNEKLLEEGRQQMVQLLSISEQLNRESAGISNSAQKQASGIEEIAASLEEMGASVSQNSEHAVKVSDISREATGLAEEGGVVVKDAIQSINEINDVSGKIQDITTIINDIAFQTNLLALNAAVEAARAGDHGRGFAVVAGEVRNLAQRSGSSAGEIENLIKDSIGKITRGTDLVNKSGESLDKIIESTRETNRIITEISAALDEQKRGIEQINEAVTEMDDLTQHNAAASEQLSGAASELSRHAEKLQAVISHED